MKNLLIKNGLVVTENSEEICDLLCSGGIIVKIGKNLAAAGAPAPAATSAPFAAPAPTATSTPDVDIIDASGKIVVPGGIDVHTHLCLDTGAAQVCDDFYSGTLAAACGGTTTIVDHPGFGPAGCNLDHQIKKYHALAEGRAIIDYGFHGVIQHVDEDVLSKMEVLSHEGISSFKLYTTYGFKLSDRDIFRVLERAGELGLLIAVHPENDGVISCLKEKFVSEGKMSPAWHPLSRPAACEAEAINRMILLAGMAGDAPLYIVHLSNALGLEFIISARRRGQNNLYAETCPQYLLLDEGLYSSPGDEGLKYLMCPPLRKAGDREALWQGLTGVIDTIATDHCPFHFKTKKFLGENNFTLCPSGAPGVEERIPLLYSEGVSKKRITLRRFTELCSSAPAKLFGLYPQKGVIKEGSDADLLIIDPEKNEILSREKLHSNVDYSAYEGFEVQGYPVCTISRGEVIVKDGVISAVQGRGKFLKREKEAGNR